MNNENDNYSLSDLLIERIGWYVKENEGKKMKPELKASYINKLLADIPEVKELFQVSCYKSTGILPSINNKSEQGTNFSTNQLGAIYELLRNIIIDEIKDPDDLFNSIEKDLYDHPLSDVQALILKEYLIRHYDRLISISNNMKKLLGEGDYLEAPKHKDKVITKTDMYIEKKNKVIDIVEFKSGTTINDGLLFRYFCQTIRYVLELYYQNYQVDKIYIHMIRSYVKPKKNIICFEITKDFISKLLK